jgi:hypothetical protein
MWVMDTARSDLHVLPAADSVTEPAVVPGPALAHDVPAGMSVRNFGPHRLKDLGPLAQVSQ